MAVDFPIFPIRLATVFGIMILSIIVIIKKILSPIKKETRSQYIIDEKTISICVSNFYGLLAQMVERMTLNHKTVQLSFFYSYRLP